MTESQMSKIIFNLGYTLGVLEIVVMRDDIPKDVKEKLDNLYEVISSLGFEAE
jgi:hypothetical protein